MFKKFLVSMMLIFTISYNVCGSVRRQNGTPIPVAGIIVVDVVQAIRIPSTTNTCCSLIVGQDCRITCLGENTHHICTTDARVLCCTGLVGYGVRSYFSSFK